MNARCHQWLLLIALAGLGVLSGKALAETIDYPAYVVGPGDVLTVSVWQNKDLTRQVTVRPDGMVSYPLVGEIRVAGLSPDDIQQAFTTRLQKFVDVKAREVTVIVDKVHSLAVSVLGEVKNPGRFEFSSRARVLDALARAGGLTQYASGAHIVILRKDGDKTERIPFNYNTVAHGGPQSGLTIRPGDVVFVP